MQLDEAFPGPSRAPERHAAFLTTVIAGLVLRSRAGARRVEPEDGVARAMHVLEVVLATGAHDLPEAAESAGEAMLF